jgi:flavocytochrome c
MSATSTVIERHATREEASLHALPKAELHGIAESDDYDVIVIGAGFAGLAAAIEARNAGASVVVLEKMKAPGGNSIISDGGIAAAGTAMQRRLGIEDSPELMYEDMLRAGLGLNQPALVRAVAEQSAESVEWSADYLGVEYLDRLDQFGGHSVLRCFTAKDVTGATIIRQQMEKLKQLGVDVRLQACLQSFLTDADGLMTGVRIREGFVQGRPEMGHDVDLMATRGVVLATGGFGADVAFRSVQDPRLDSLVDTTNKTSATAEALIEALRIGAMPVHLSHIQLGPWASPDEKGYGVGPRFADYVVFQYGLVVSPLTSSRIVNELGDRKMVADAILGVGSPCIGIADARAVRDSGWSIDRCLEKGVVKTFDTLRDLAQFYGLDADAVTATVERFNGHIAAGADPDFAKPLIAGAAPLVEPPFYAMRLWPKVHHTMGGVQIDAEARVIDIDGNPIRRLYAAGEVAGGVHGACRLGSCAITECLVFGRIAGRNAATASPRE